MKTTDGTRNRKDISGREEVWTRPTRNRRTFVDTTNIAWRQDLNKRGGTLAVYKSSRAHKHRLMTGRKLTVEKPAGGGHREKNRCREEKENRIRYNQSYPTAVGLLGLERRQSHPDGLGMWDRERHFQCVEEY